jgi:hypothetical protein
MEMSLTILNVCLFLGKLGLNNRFASRSMKVNGPKSPWCGEIGIIPELEMVWVRYLDPEAKIYNYHFFKYLNGKVIKINKPFRVKTHLATDTYLIYYHGFFLLRVFNDNKIKMFDTKNHRFVGSTVIKKRGSRRSLYNFHSFRTFLVTVTYIHVHLSVLSDYIYCFELYEDKVRIGSRVNFFVVLSFVVVSEFKKMAS